MFKWWKDTTIADNTGAKFKVSDENFGIVPLEESREEVDLQQLTRVYKPSVAYIAFRQKQSIPYLPVCTNEERKVFIKQYPFLM